MLAAMEHLVKTSGDLNQLDSQGAAPVGFVHFLIIISAYVLLILWKNVKESFNLQLVST